MVRTVMSKEQVFADRMKRVCKAAKTGYVKTNGAFAEGRGRRYRYICRFTGHYGKARNKLLCKREDVSRTQQIAKLLEKEGIASQVDVVVVPAIEPSASFEFRRAPPKMPTSYQPKHCAHCGGTWKVDRHGRCKRCGAPR